MKSNRKTPVISLMLAVPDALRAVEWYQRVLGARLLWSLGSVAGLEIEGEPAKNGWNSPQEIGTTTTRVELFCDDPEAVIQRALEAGAAGSLEEFRDHKMPWGIHRQGGFTDPFGHIWLVGDRSPLNPFPSDIKRTEGKGEN